MSSENSSSAAVAHSIQHFNMAIQVPFFILDPETYTLHLFGACFFGACLKQEGRASVNDFPPRQQGSAQAQALRGTQGGNP